MIGVGYAWTYLAEIYAPTTFSLAPRSHPTLTPRWIIDGRNGGDGWTAEHMFKKLGWHDVRVLLATDERAVEHVVANASVLVKYVRRNIYNLTGQSRSSFLEGLRTVYATPGDEGRRKYGSAYRSMAELVELHLAGAAARECDSWHDDAAFTVKHVAITLLLEVSLQTIDARLTVPYWDYSADAASCDPWTQARFFRDEWFGSASPHNELHIVDRGRWAYTPVEVVPIGERSTTIVNPYGLIRSPWNVNPTPYVTRNRYVLGLLDGGFALPTPDRFEWATTDVYTLSMLTSLLNGFLHGEVHIMLGGHWGLYNQSERIHIRRGNNGMLLSSKMLWRQGLVACPLYCAADSPPASNCRCSCPAGLSDAFLASRNASFDIGDEESRASALLDASGVFRFNPDFAMDDWLADSGVESWSRLWELLCRVGTPGEMFSSAAPYDPAFWPLHGLADRLLTKRRAMAATGSVRFDETWGYAHDMATVASDDHLVCDWTPVHRGLSLALSTVIGVRLAGETELPSCIRGTCPGHREDDLLPFAIPGAGTLTNREFYHYMSPSSAEYPYVYDAL